ncbi:hypothetical protein PSCICO_17330 [Pseudomonas cichorii]|jgi:hypothetical protein|nr:hypothetical protein PSCICO_17330 [Pseudomonas cichorii]
MMVASEFNYHGHGGGWAEVTVIVNEARFFAEEKLDALSGISWPLHKFLKPATVSALAKIHGRGVYMDQSFIPAWLSKH